MYLPVFLLSSLATKWKSAKNNKKKKKKKKKKKCKNKKKKKKKCNLLKKLIIKTDCFSLIIATTVFYVKRFCIVSHRI